jgi:pantothenate kinase
MKYVVVPRLSFKKKLHDVLVILYNTMIQCAKKLKMCVVQLSGNIVQYNDTMCKEIQCVLYNCLKDFLMRYYLLNLMAS